MDAILSPVLEIPAPAREHFEIAPPDKMPGIMNFLGYPAGAVPFGRVTEADLK